MVTGGGARAIARCDELGVAPYSDMADGLYRGYLTPAYTAAQQAVGQWMRAAGMAVARDAAANLVGRYPGLSDGPALILGSHLDSVRDGGRYDGPLGVLLAIECIAMLHAANRHMPFPIHVYAFGDEEGSRFPAAMLTSRAVAGTLDPLSLDAVDAAGIRLDALIDRDAFAGARHPPALAYLEAHIEQGPVLEAAGLPVGTVTAIAAQRRYAVEVTGRAGHAGTTAMALRRDALAGAAAMIVAIERIAHDGPADLVATVGRIEIAPGAANVVPGEARFAIDVRAGSDGARDAAATAILAACRTIAAERGLSFASEMLQDLAASPSDPALVAMLDAGIAAAGIRPLQLVSGAGHDAMILATLCPTAMLFIRCRGGISHHPDEHVDPADAEVALAVMHGFIERLGAQADG